MPLISKRVYKARNNYKCTECGKSITPGEEYASLFGSAFRNEKPFQIKMCLMCFQKACEAKCF